MFWSGSPGCRAAGRQGTGWITRPGLRWIGGPAGTAGDGCRDVCVAADVVDDDDDDDGSGDGAKPFRVGWRTMGSSFVPLPGAATAYSGVLSVFLQDFLSCRAQESFIFQFFSERKYYRSSCAKVPRVRSYFDKFSRS